MELEGWNKFIRILEIAVIGAGLRDNSDTGVTTRTKGEDEVQRKFVIEQREFWCWIVWVR